MNFVSTLGAAALSCLLLPAAFASEPAGTALESSSAAIAPEVREVEKAPSSELAAAPAASSQEASSDSQSDTSNAFAKTRTCTTTCAVKLCKALGITEDELAASILIAEPRHKHGSKLETPSKEAMEEVASTKARRKKDESDTEEECGTSTVSLKRPRRSSK